MKAALTRRTPSLGSAMPRRIRAGPARDGARPRGVPGSSSALAPLDPCQSCAGERGWDHRPWRGGRCSEKVRKREEVAVALVDRVGVGRRVVARPQYSHGPEAVALGQARVGP